MAGQAIHAIAMALIATSAVAAPGDTPPVAIKDPHYGDSLFHFYQEKYFTAITSLMVSQHFGRVAHHGDEAEVLRGGLLLSYGMHREAGEIFERLIDAGAAPSVRDRAWYYLAKIRYQRGFLNEAQQAIERVGKSLPAELQEDRALLHANLLMARGDYTAAADVLKQMTGHPSAGLYARYNLGVALVRSGDPKGGAAFLEDVGSAPVAPDATEEFRSLRDRANVALGFAALQEGKPEGARVVLERVRLNGLHANKALLGFGWAAAALKQPKLALVPWTELSERDVGDAAALEARIALPYALAELGAFGQSLERYNDAISQFERESTHLDESIAAIRAGKLLEGLLEANPGEEMGWFWAINELPELPHANHLTLVLAQHEFQEAFKNYRDLRFLEQNLEQWSESLGAFGDIVATRRQAFAQRVPRIMEQARNSGLEPLQQRRAALGHELAAVEANVDAGAFADAHERELLARLESSRVTMESARPGSAIDAEAAQARERWRRVAGALTWQLAQAYPQRLWEATKGLQVTDAQLAQARASEQALARAQRDEPARFDAFDTRIGGLAQRLKALLPQVAALHREQQQQVQELAVAELLRQKERLAQYSVQARFAVAQLMDRATSGGRSEGRAPQ